MENPKTQKADLQRIDFALKVTPMEKRIIDTYLSTVERGHSRGDVVRRMLMAAAVPVLRERGLLPKEEEGDLNNAYLETIR